jgi:CxxC motif-containing protein (DUF1111 family)
MRKSYFFNKILSAIIIVWFLVSCKEASIEPVYNPSGKIAHPRELSADDLTIFTSSSVAFDTPSNQVGGALLDRFLKGDKLYDQPRVSNPTDAIGTGGLGPLYVGFSCTSCHEKAGRVKSTLFTHGGSGDGFSSQLVFLKSTNGQYFRDYGRVLHDQAIFGVKPEGKINVSYSEKTYAFPTEDEEPYSLITPNYWLSELYAADITNEQLVMSVRTPLRHVGLGLMMAVDKNELQQLASISYPEYGISGEINWVIEKNQLTIGLSGHKAQHADLTVELGFLSDMGVTNDRFPEEIGAGQPQITEDFGIEISTEDMANVELYLYNLGVPARRNVKDPAVVLGEKKFFDAKCNLCHTPTLHTGSDIVKLLDGTRLPHLSNKTIHPYSDYLLHDMGPELGDDYNQFNASGDEWRTTPLWGIGLQEVVNGHSHFLHDGRARNFTEAIMWHGGEGSVSREIFKKMTKTERDALLMFLKSL